MSTNKMGYLPNETPSSGQLVLLGLQHVLTMFPATVLVALITGFHVGTVLFASGVSTIVALYLSKRGIGKFIPLFYGSSFSYLAAYFAIIGAMGGDPSTGPVSDEIISTMQAGIVVTGIFNIVVGLIIQRVGKDAIDKVLPPVVTGSVAAIIGFGLAAAALNWAAENWAISISTMVLTILFSVYLQNRGFFGMIPVLLGGIAGYIISYFVAPELLDFTQLSAASWFTVPHFTFPVFSGEFVATAIFSISIMAIATIPESTAHLYQISLYVDRYAEERKEKPYELDKHIGFNLVLDGIGDFINGLMGATAGTNYGENNSLMAITRNYSGPALMAAGVIAMLLGFVGKLAEAVGTIPFAVTGGLAVYLFGVIGMQGIALMQENKVDMFIPRNLAIGAVIMIVGIGGNIGFSGGFLPIPIFQGVFPSGLPAIATAAVLGILLNAVFLVFDPPKS